MNCEDRIELALEFAVLGLNDGAEHKMWVIDQMVRALTDEDYKEWVKNIEAGENGPHTYDWDTGIAP